MNTECSNFANTFPVSRNMKLPLIIIFATFSFLTSLSQSPVDFGKFPVQQNDTTTLFTKNLLDRINWQAINSFSKTAQGHYVDEKKDSLLTTYRYVKQGYESSFEIVSYKGMVLEYYSDPGNSKQQSKTSYFDKNVWLKYVSEKMPTLANQLKLTKEEPSNILKAYYRLIGTDTRDEYGFICEYSTVGMATTRRMAIIQLLQEHRLDLIRRLIDYSNLQTRLYAIDALIYYDYSTKQKIEKLEQVIKQKQKQLDRLQKKNIDKPKAEDLQSQINLSSDSITYYNAKLLTDSEWKMIYDLRDSNQIVRTCGNMGSYKIYATPISELLSDKAIADIPKQYEGLGRLGYFR